MFWMSTAADLLYVGKGIWTGFPKAWLLRVINVFVNVYINRREWCRFLVHILIFSPFLNPFPHTANLQQTTLRMSTKNMENLYNCRYNYWKKLKTLCQKEKLIVWAISPFVTMFWKVVCWWERVNQGNLYFHQRLNRFPLADEFWRSCCCQHFRTLLQK